MKVIIAGSRTFNDYNLLKKYCNKYLQNQTEIEIVSGTANGADKLGEQYANEFGYKITQFPAKWDKYGKLAGFKRNEDMAKYADSLIAFWDGTSRGTQNMIELAKKYSLPYRIINYNEKSTKSI